VVSVSRLTRRFGQRPAVEDLAFEIRAGEVFVLLGPNGAGKTTTMRLLAGLIAPSAGTIAIDGVTIHGTAPPAVRSRIGLLTESPGLWERLPARTNLLVYARLHHLREPDRVVARALDRFGLAARANDPPASFSKGMKQKLAIARALLHDPALVLLDEPTAGLDPEIARSVRELILELRAQGRAVLVSTHNLDEAERIADRVAVVRTRLLALDTPDALRRRLFGHRVRIDLSAPADRFASVAVAAGARGVHAEGATLTATLERPDEQVPALVRALVDAGASIRGVADERPPLEDVYLRLTSLDGRAAS
jgi:ABC-2 type transport system ATP-binding protein